MRHHIISDTLPSSQGRCVALEEAKSELEDQREEAVRQVQHLQQELTHAQSHAAKHERDMLQVCLWLLLLKRPCKQHPRMLVTTISYPKTPQVSL